MRHICDAFGDLASLVWSQVRREPIVRESHDAADGSALMADLCVRGVWQPQANYQRFQQRCHSSIDSGEPWPAKQSQSMQLKHCGIYNKSHKYSS